MKDKTLFSRNFVLEIVTLGGSRWGGGKGSVVCRGSHLKSNDIAAGPRTGLVGHPFRENN